MGNKIREAFSHTMNLLTCMYSISSEKTDPDINYLLSRADLVLLCTKK